MKIADLEGGLDQWLSALGGAIKEARKEKGLSQEALANLAQIDRSHMGRIERGQRNVTFANLLKIAESLECLPSALLKKAGL